MTATVAGTAPAARTSAAQASAVSTFCGDGRPWLTMVDSKATTARPSASAADTSSDTRSRSVDFCSTVPVWPV